MANLKISQLPVATTVADVDTHVIVQGGVTKKVTHAIILSAVNAELVAINGLVDDLNTAISGIPTAVTIYNSSGELFDTGVATTRDFLFKTSDNATYNPSGTYHEMRFNAAYNDSGGYSTSPGWFGMKGAGINNKLAVFNMYGGGTPTLEMFAVDTVVARTRTLQLSSDSLYLGTETASGAINLQFSDSGAVISDFRTPPLNRGLEYAADYLVGMASNDRSLPDVATVKFLRTHSNLWTTAGRPAAQTGVHGFNTDTSKFEGYNGTTWVDFH